MRDGSAQWRGASVVAAAAALALVACTGRSDQEVVRSSPQPVATVTAPPPVIQCQDRDLPFDPKGVDLTGAWEEPGTGAIYYIRQVGDAIWWVGMNGLGGPEDELGKEFSQAGNGTISQDLAIELDWSDVPRGVLGNPPMDPKGYGTLFLEVDKDQEGQTVIRLVRQTTAHDGRLWIPCEPFQE